jgi:extradiol dioxygenase family protein
MVSRQSSREKGGKCDPLSLTLRDLRRRKRFYQIEILGLEKGNWENSSLTFDEFVPGMYYIRARKRGLDVRLKKVKRTYIPETAEGEKALSNGRRTGSVEDY